MVLKVDNLVKLVSFNHTKEVPAKTKAFLIGHILYLPLLYVSLVVPQITVLLLSPLYGCQEIVMRFYGLN